MFDSEKSEKIKVLVVDDSLLVRVAATKMLGNDFDVVLAVDGKDGWNTIQNDEDIQVVFTDLVMPEMDGFELLQKIRTSKKESICNLPVIVTTGADNPEIAKQKAINLGATDFITKPFDASAIRTRALSYANLHQTSEKLREHTTLDVLTGHMNGKGFDRQLEKEIAFVVRHQSRMTVMAIEIDGFKDLFIRVGRKGTETIIRKIGEVLATIVRREDTIARTGLATFMVSMPLAMVDNTLEVADQIARTVASLQARIGGNKLRITTCIGVCGIEPNKLTSPATVLEVAYQALKKAQGAGTNQIARLTANDFEVIQARKAAESLSLDQLLIYIGQKNYDAVIPYLDLAIDRLAPLMGLLSLEQKQKLISSRPLEL
jgi:two-component system, cell cycle response regulator